MFDIFSIIKFIKSKITYKDCLLIGILFLLFLLTRLIYLDKFPIFTDEGIYIHWAKLAWNDASWRFVSLTDGRQPLQTWVTIPFLKLLPDNALLAGRLFAVTTGLAALIGLATLTGYLFGKKAAYISAFLYIFTPFFLFYDRLALMDSGINAAFVWILFLSILLVKTIRLDVALVFGLVAGISTLAKSSTQFFIGLSIFAPLLLIEKKLSQYIKKSLNYLLLFMLVGLLTIAIYNIQRLSPFLHFVKIKNTTFIYTIPELIKNPLASFPFNLYSIPYYVLVESGFFLPIIGSIGWVLLLKNERRLGIYLSLWTILSFIVICFVARVMYPRYIIFFASIFAVFLTYLIVELYKKNKSSLTTILVLFFISVAYFNFTILFDFKNIPLPEIDRGQYIEGGSSGLGIKEIVDYARNISLTKSVRILAEGTFGMSGDVLDVFLKKDDKITIKSYWPLEIKDLIANQQDLNKEKILVLFAYKKISEIPENYPIKLVKIFEKPGGKSSFLLFELLNK